MSKSTDLLACYLHDTEDAVGVVEYIREKWPKSLNVYLSAVKTRWYEFEVHNPEFPLHYTAIVDKLNELAAKSKANSKDGRLCSAARKKLAAFNEMKLADKVTLQRAIKSTAYSGIGEVDDDILALQLLPSYMNDLKVSVREKEAMQKIATAALELKSVNTFTIQASELLAKCRAIAENDLANAFDIACSLALLTGRRMIEIFKTGMFTERARGKHSKSAYRMLFVGQAKKNTAVAVDNGYIIPVLTEPSVILSALTRLRRLKVADAMDNKTVNLTWSNSCNASARRLIGPERTFHDLRSIYAAIVYQCSLPHRWSMNAFVSRILGHAGLSKSLHYTSIHVEGLSEADRITWEDAM